MDQLVKAEEYDKWLATKLKAVYDEENYGDVETDVDGMT